MAAGRSRWLRRAALLGVVLVLLGWGDHREAGGIRLLLAGVLILAGVVAVWRHGRSGSAGAVRRISSRSRRRDGVASRWVILRSASRFAVRRKMRVLRPSTRDMSLFARMRVPTLALATPLARVGLLRIWSPCEDVTVRVGGPRTGKTGEIAGRILDAPGAVIATSTRTDLLELTGPVRSRVGPVWVFNPSGLGRLDSTVVFDPLSGCNDPKTATYRASDLLSGSDGPGSNANGDREFWQKQAVRVLAAMMHAAALGGASMRDVQRWVASPDAHAGDVQRQLRHSKQDAIATDALQFLNTNERTQTSISSTIMPALAWLNDDTAAKAAGQHNGLRVDRAGFDVAELLAQNGTVYILGAEDAQVAPLVCALTGHIARTARQIASEMRGGRLDPQLTLALDEAAVICPIPLDSWSADMGGRNVTIHIAVQSRAQIRKRWGDTGAAAILNNAATLLIFGGTRDVEDLTAYSVLAGERHERIRTHDQHGRVAATTYQRVPVLSPAQFAQLAAGRVVIIRRGMPPAIGRVQMAWKRHDVRTVARQDRRYARRADRQAVWTARRAVWAVRWAELRALLEAGLTALAQRIDQAAERRRAGDDGRDGGVSPDA
jgi:type IV secretion system protein VirD4